MAIRNKTIRRLHPNSRKLARIINELDSTLTRLKHFLPTVQEMEQDSHALYNRLSTYEKKAFAQEKADMEAADKVLAGQQEIPHTDEANPQSDGPLFDEAEHKDAPAEDKHESVA
jgi:paraquat-inducible protein B